MSLLIVIVFSSFFRIFLDKKDQIIAMTNAFGL